MTEMFEILLVDDYEPMRSAIAKWLTEDGNKVVVAGDGQEALKAILNGSVASRFILITDMQMPVMNGLELVLNIRTHGITPLGCIVVSGLGLEHPLMQDMELVLRGIGLAYGVFDKPPSLVALKEAIMGMATASCAIVS